MAKQDKPAVVHYSDGEKIICGTKNGRTQEDGLTTSGNQTITCKRCIGLLQTRQFEEKPETPQETSTPIDPNAIHFSDGVKAACGVQDVQSVKDEQKVTCTRCQAVLTKKAQVADDPLIVVRVKNMDLNDGVDFTFSFGRDKENPKQMKGYHLVNNAVHRLPRSVVEHMRTLSYPYKRYVPGTESGRAMQVAGRYTRFVVQELQEN